MKKKYKNLVPLVLIIFMVAGWYQLNSKAVETHNEYAKYVSEARKYAEIGVTTYAQANYLKALQIKESFDLRFELAEYYKKNSNLDTNLEWCEAIQEKYPTNVKIYDRLLEIYFQAKDYKSCYDTISLAKKRQLSSKYISDTENKIAYEYRFEQNRTYDDVSAFMDDYCAVKSEDNWGFINSEGKLIASCQFKKVSSFSNDNAAVVAQDDSIYFINSEGNKSIATKETKYSEFGMISGGMMTAVSNGKYMYLKDTFDKLFGDYDFASAMNNVAAVKIGDSWSIIDSNGKNIGTEKYKDVIIDENGYACRRNRLFVRNSDGYVVMLDNQGNKLSNQVFEDAKLFSFDKLAAVKLEGKWGFVDENGKQVIKPQYEDARSFSYGLAAVKDIGKWGFIDNTGNIKIKAEFYDAKDFNSEGSCFVNIGNTWQLLKLYRNLSSEG